MAEQQETASIKKDDASTKKDDASTKKDDASVNLNPTQGRKSVSSSCDQEKSQKASKLEKSKEIIKTQTVLQARTDSAKTERLTAGTSSRVRKKEVTIHLDADKYRTSRKDSTSSQSRPARTSSAGRPESHTITSRGPTRPVVLNPPSKGHGSQNAHASKSQRPGLQKRVSSGNQQKR